MRHSGVRGAAVFGLLGPALLLLGRSGTPGGIQALDLLLAAAVFWVLGVRALRAGVGVRDGHVVVRGLVRTRHVPVDRIAQVDDPVDARGAAVLRLDDGSVVRLTPIGVPLLGSPASPRYRAAVDGLRRDVEAARAPGRDA